MELLRTPDDRFADLSGHSFAPNYVEVDIAEGDELADPIRVHYLDEGPSDAPPVLMLHGEPTWSYLYRKLVPPLVAAGHRVVAPDLVGFGRSDKPARREDYTYQRHVDWVRDFVERVELREITLVAQDWGGLLGLRVLADVPNRFARVVAANTFLPTGDPDNHPGDMFLRWQAFSQEMPSFDAAAVVDLGTAGELAASVKAAYDAPFPDESYTAGAREFPMLVPTRPDDPASEANRGAWEFLRRWDRPFLCAYSDRDPIMAGFERQFIEQVPGCTGQPHTTIEGAGHFLQEDKGDELAQVIVDWLA